MNQNRELGNKITSIPPQAIEAEEAVLGGILLDPNAMERISDILTTEAFYIRKYAVIYEAALSLYAQGKPTDLIMMTTWLKDRNLLVAAGGANQLAALVENLVSTTNIDLLAELIMEKYVRRSLIFAGNNIVQLGYDNAGELLEVLDKAEQEIFKVSQNQIRSGLVPMTEGILKTLADLESRESDVFMPGLVSDFYDLDALTSGFQRSDLIIMAGRPSMGKTSLGLNVARNIAQRYQLPVAIFSLEMSQEQLVQRMLSMESGIPTNRIRGGRVAQADWDKLYKAFELLNQLPIFIDDTAVSNVMQIRSAARKLQAKNGKLGLILLDYIQLMGGDSDNRVQELSKITRSLKALARELNVPIIALSQLSRGVESRNDKRPMMSDLRDSGSIEQDADVVIMLYRDEYYNPGTPDKAIAEVIIAKHRNGPTGTAKLIFNSELTLFKNLRKPS